MLELFIAAVVGPVVTGIFAYLAGRRRNNAEVEALKGQANVSSAEASSIIANAAASIVQPLTDRIAGLIKENESLRAEVLDLKIQVKHLTVVVEEMS